jgi:hypothetical protein
MGTLNTGDVLVDITNPVADPATNNFGWALLGNPYQSSVSIDSFTTENASQIDGTVYIYQSSAKYDGAYASRTSSGISIGGIGAHIAPFQAFFVRSKEANGTVKFTNDMRAPSFHGEAHQRTEGSTEDYQGILKLKAALQDTPEASSEAAFTFHPEASEGKDARHEAYLIKYHPKDDIHIMLEDTETGILQDLQTSPTYRFAIGQGWHDQRFVLHFIKTQTISGLTLEEIGNKFHCYGKSGQVHINFLDPDWADSKIQVLDMMGRVIGKVDNSEAQQQSVSMLSGENQIVIIRLQNRHGVFNRKCFVK